MHKKSRPRGKRSEEGNTGRQQLADLSLLFSDFAKKRNQERKRTTQQRPQRQHGVPSSSPNRDEDHALAPAHSLSSGKRTKEQQCSTFATTPSPCALTRETGFWQPLSCQLDFSHFIHSPRVFQNSFFLLLAGESSMPTPRTVKEGLKKRQQTPYLSQCLCHPGGRGPWPESSGPGLASSWA